MSARRTIVLAALAAFATAGAARAGTPAPTPIYNPVVSMVGDGTASVAGQGRTTTLQVYAHSVPGQVVPVSQLAFASGTTGTRLTNTINSTSEGALSNNPATANAAAFGDPAVGAVYTYSAGYDAANQTTSVTGNTANAPRVVGYMNVTTGMLSGATIPVSQTYATAYTNNTFRSATGDDTATQFWTGGNGSPGSSGGWRYFNDNTQLTTTNSTNVRTTEILGSQLFGSTGAGSTRGIYAIGTGLPTTTGQTATNLIATGSSSSPYEFVLMNDPSNGADTSNTFGFDTAYIADDSSIANNGGIQKWVWNGTSWSNVYTLNDGIGGSRGLAGQKDRDSGIVTLWATSADGTRLAQVTDLGAGSGFTTLATVSTNNLFRGVALAPVPEPALLGLTLLGAALLPLRRSRRAVAG